MSPQQTFRLANEARQIRKSERLLSEQLPRVLVDIIQADPKFPDLRYRPRGGINQ